MKKMKLVLMLLPILCSVAFTSCKGEEENGKDPKEITLGMIGNNGDVIVVSGIDISKDITISATEAVNRDVELSITTDAADGSAILATTTAKIAKGTDKAVVKITFPSSKFPEGTPEKAIKVTVSTTDAHVVVSPSFTTFNVKGEHGLDALSILTVTSDKLEVNTTDADGVAVLNFALSKAIEKDVEITCTYGNPEDFVGSAGVSWNPYPVKILKGQTTLKVSITVPKERVGSMPILFSCANSNVTVETAKITFMFVSTPNPNPEASISSTSAVAVNIDKADVSRTLDITLSKEADKTVTVQLAVTSNNTLKGTLSASSVTFNKGEITKTADITFTKADFIKDSKANVTVTITSSDVDIKASASSLEFNVAGPMTKLDGKVNITYYRDDDKWLAIASGSTITFTAEEKAQGYIPITAAGGSLLSFGPDVKFALETEGDLTPNDVELSSATLIYEGSKYGYADFKLKTSAIGKTGTIRFTSTGTTFDNNQDLVITVAE